MQGSEGRLLLNSNAIDLVAQCKWDMNMDIEMEIDIDRIQYVICILLQLINDRLMRFNIFVLFLFLINSCSLRMIVACTQSELSSLPSHHIQAIVYLAKIQCFFFVSPFCLRLNHLQK